VYIFWEDGVAGSSPVTPIKNVNEIYYFFYFSLNLLINGIENLEERRMANETRR
jgi:hypothetical protein